MKTKISILSLVVAATTAATAPQATVREIDGDQRVIDVQINGRAARLEVEPETSDAPVLTAVAAARLGLKGSFVAGVHFVGPTRLEAESNLVTLTLPGAKPYKRRAFFLPWDSINDGMVSPLTLPDPVVRFRLRASQPGEREITFPLRENRAGAYFVLRKGEAAMPVFFSLARGETMANADAGLMLARAFGGTMAGETREIAIEYGISRPVRALQFAEAPAVEGLALRNVVVRTSDTGSTAMIADSANGGETDSEEIVVEGSAREPRPRLFIGRDTLAACSSLTFDRPAKLIRLSCRSES